MKTPIRSKTEKKDPKTTNENQNGHGMRVIGEQTGIGGRITKIPGGEPKDGKRVNRSRLPRKTTGINGDGSNGSGTAGGRNNGWWRKTNEFNPGKRELRANQNEVL